MKHVHVIPVPFGATPEDAWAEIKTMGKLVFPPASDSECGWAAIECDGDECESVATCVIELGTHVAPYWRDANRANFVVCSRHRSQYEERVDEFGPFDWQPMSEETP